MSEQTTTKRERAGRLGAALAGCLGLWLAATGPGARADEKPAAKPRPAARTAVGRCAIPVGTLLRREKPDGPWQRVKVRETAYTRDTLLALPGSRTEITARNRAVRLTLAGNLPELAPVPLYESAVVLHAGRDFDLDLTLDRGRIHLTNLRNRG